jgi:hypothetical protein
VKKAIPAQLRQKKKYVSSMQSVSHSEQLVDVWCKDLRTIRLGFGCFTDARKLVRPYRPPFMWPVHRARVPAHAHAMIISSSTPCAPMHQPL